MMPQGYDLHSQQVFLGMPDVPNKADVPQTLPGGIKTEQLPQEVRNLLPMMERAWQFTHVPEQPVQSLGPAGL